MTTHTTYPTPAGRVPVAATPPDRRPAGADATTSAADAMAYIAAAAALAIPGVMDRAIQYEREGGTPTVGQAE